MAEEVLTTGLWLIIMEGVKGYTSINEKIITNFHCSVEGENI
jgi:hypothetical protein